MRSKESVFDLAKNKVVSIMGSGPHVNKTNVVTRFAPSPTGFLHIGGARTALFNWLFARHHGGQFLLRIEDTDRSRSTDQAVAAILDGLKWLELDWDGEAISQASCADRHREIAQALLEKGHAYRCFATQEELQAAREQARAEGRPLRFASPWRDSTAVDHPEGRPFVIRFKAPLSGETVIEDHVQGLVRVPNQELDDMVLLRSDGSPTYMLSVVVDDHDMGVTHIIRGDDHLTNAFRQIQIIHAMDWTAPVYAHIPLIHGPDGKKLSKRHGALGIDAYQEMGYLPQALRNYLLRLGWGHGDTELISTEDAIELFSLEGIGKGAACFDFKKLASFNGHYIRQSSPARLCEQVRPFLEKDLNRGLLADDLTLLSKAMPGLQERAKTLLELSESALFLFKERPLLMNEPAEKILNDEARSILASSINALEPIKDWSASSIEQALQAFAEAHELKFGKVAQPLRAALTGSNVSPGIYDVLEVLGRDESLGRLRDQTKA
ncbi:glutamate--tRNA ligase 2 [Iodidimonas nitroreducens]|uniref:Glutamate--tRNA ligase n=2 Tax=Iodidimonas nitroreducens TaxID=1236968 RepID=A0A5A7N5L7_9PROT|nr:glutamate--tRNA ligase 2 [alpha proteobacterium Q-1]GER02945.1 glutamate--tRNA ligase 2 [Iodidimonas nitroreducens]